MHAVMLALICLAFGWGLAACGPARAPETVQAGSATPQEFPAPAPSPTATVTPTPEPTPTPAPQVFDAERAMQDVLHQVELGPRLPGSPAHEQAMTWIAAELEAAGWEVEIQETTEMDQPVKNVIAGRGEGEPWLVLGAHYDSRLVADQDPDPAKRGQPVPGANDGASGVAVLLELARILPTHPTEAAWPGKISLVFFDSEDNGRIPGWDWILGSRAYVRDLQDLPEAAVIVDMIGDADLNVYLENNSDPDLRAEIWAAAAQQGYSAQFIPEPKYTILDDHIPFKEAGVPAVDIIDFDYPHWHTTEDTADKVSGESLKAVGDTLLAWILGPLPQSLAE